MTEQNPWRKAIELLVPFARVPARTAAMRCSAMEQDSNPPQDAIDFAERLLKTDLDPGSQLPMETEILLLREALAMYGDRVRMATAARPDLQQVIDVAMEDAAGRPELFAAQAAANAIVMLMVGQIVVQRLQRGGSIILPGVGRVTSTMRRVRTVKSPEQGGVQQIRVRYARLVGSVIPEVSNGE